VLRLDDCAGWPVRWVASASLGACPRAGCHLLAVTERYPMAGPAAGSWTGCRAHWVRSVHSGVQSVQLVRSGRGAVPMVRRRSTVRFRKGALSSAIQFRNYLWSDLSFSWTGSWRRSSALSAQDVPPAPEFLLLNVVAARQQFSTGACEGHRLQPSRGTGRHGSWLPGRCGIRPAASVTAATLPVSR
jgi:hypothetical protein